MSNYEVLKMQGITKRFAGVTALLDVDFSCNAGEVHALMGENGAGKSTLIKILSGAYHQDHGEIFFKGKPLNLRIPLDAQNAGISTIYQELNLVPCMNAVENIFLGRESINRGIVNFTEMRKKAQEILATLGIELNVNKPVDELSVAQQQMVEIAKALSFNASLIIMDEPTSSLCENEIQHLYEIVNKLRKRGVTVIYISHRLEEVFTLADRVTVLKDGRYVGTKHISQVDKQGLIQMMVGRQLEEIYPNRGQTHEQTILEVKDLSRKDKLNKISFKLHSGEILGISGLVGSGRTDLARALFGADRYDSGQIEINGSPVVIRSPQDAMKHSIGFVTEDRKNQGLVLELSVKHNATLSILESLQKLLFIDQKEEEAIVNEYIEKIRIRTPSAEAPVKNLSGGNQQKVVLTKWLARNCKIIILDEPTRGVDVGAKVEIYSLMRKLANEGLGIIMISSELPEILGMSDRILVMREGALVGEFLPEEASEEALVSCAIGGGH